MHRQRQTINELIMDVRPTEAPPRLSELILKMKMKTRMKQMEKGTQFPQNFAGETIGEGCMAGLVDSHCHVLEDDYGAETAAVLERAARAGVTRMLVIGGDMRTSRHAVETAEKYASSGVFAAVGIHPHEAATVPSCSVEGKGIPEELRRMAEHPRVLAIGETGLDYHYEHSPRDQQQNSFREHIRLAAEIGKPLVIHGRESYDDLLRILCEERGEQIRAVVHCFSGTEEDASAFLEMGYFLSFGGPLTFPKNDALRALFRGLPLDRILMETDSPWLTPHPFRGKRNEPMHVRRVYEKAAEIRGIPFAEFAAVMGQNAAHLFEWGVEFVKGEGTC